MKAEQKTKAIKAKPDLRTTIDSDLLALLKKVSRERRVPMSALVERALDHYFRGWQQGGVNGAGESRAS